VFIERIEPILALMAGFAAQIVHVRVDRQDQRDALPAIHHLRGTLGLELADAPADCGAR
jgi:hypothetical protein